MEFEYNTIEEKFKSLPEHLQEVMTSPGIANAVKSIGERHGLKIDQQGALFDHTSFVLLGLAPSQEFVKNFSQDAQLDKEVAQAIAGEINIEVFSKIKAEMQRSDEAREVPIVKPEPPTPPRSHPMLPPTPPPSRAPTGPSPLPPQLPRVTPGNIASSITSLERAGGFTIEKKGPAETDRGSINFVNPTNIEHVKTSLDHTKMEPLIDQMLRTPTAMPTENVTRVEPPRNLPTNDPYRESAL